MSKIKLTPYQQHVAKWKNCEQCDLHCHRKRVVLCRGTVPCKILFVGEAPGASEDVVGKPFMGPAGKLLDRMLEEAGFNEGPVSYAMTNLTACIPLDEEHTKASEPPKHAIEACSHRLIELYQLCNPEAVVWVGELPAKYGTVLLQEYGLKVAAKITHPAAILRMELNTRGLSYQRNVVILEELLERITVPWNYQ